MKHDIIFNKKKFLGIVPCSKDYYFINRNLIDFNYKADLFYLENAHNLYFTTTWTKKKK